MRHVAAACDVFDNGITSCPIHARCGLVGSGFGFGREDGIAVVALTALRL